MEINSSYNDYPQYCRLDLLSKYSLSLSLKVIQRVHLKDSNSIVVTESMARKYFGDDEPMGKVLTMNPAEYNVFTVTGVIKDVPEEFSSTFRLYYSNCKFLGMVGWKTRAIGA